MALVVEAMLAPLSADAPCGVDLGYEPQLLALSEAATPAYDYVPGPDGREVRRLLPRDWARIQTGTIELLKRGRDLRALVLLVRAQLAREGLPGFAEAMTLLRGALERWWEEVHPVLDHEERDPVDQAQARRSVLGDLVSGEGLLAELRRAPLVEVPGVGRVSFRDLQLADGLIPPGPDEARPERSRLDAILKGALPNETLEQARADLLARVRASLESALADTEAIEALFQERLGDPMAAPSFPELRSLLAELAKALPAPAAVEAPPPPGPSGERTPGGQVETGRDRLREQGPMSGRIESREDVLRALDQVLDYYHRQEPSSPVPLLLQRAKRLVPLGFLEAMADLAPGAVQDLRRLAGLEEGSG